MPKITPIRPGGEPPTPAPYAELREKLEEQRKRTHQAISILTTLSENLLDDDENSSGTAAGTAALLNLVYWDLCEMETELAGEVKP